MNKARGALPFTAGGAGHCGRPPVWGAWPERWRRCSCAGSPSRYNRAPLTAFEGSRMSFAFVFPGQGSQSVGMLADFSAQSEVRARHFAEASAALGYDLWALIQQGPPSSSTATEFTQPAMLAAGVATVAAVAGAGRRRSGVRSGSQPGRVHRAGVRRGPAIRRGNRAGPLSRPGDAGGGAGRHRGDGGHPGPRGCGRSSGLPRSLPRRSRGSRAISMPRDRW